MKCNAMMMNLTEQDMLELWKMRLGLTQSRRDCVIEREDGEDFDAKLLMDIRQWYASLLASAVTDWLPVEDVSDKLDVKTSDDGVVTVVLPDNCVRPVAFHVRGWKCDAAQFHVSGTIVAKQQDVEWLKGDSSRPIAVVDDTVISLYSVKSGEKAVVDKALCVVKPTDGSYIFSEEALQTMPNI